MTPGVVGALDLARWQDVQQDIRHLALQRGLRFIAASMLAPFGVTGVDRRPEGSGPGLPVLAFGLALILLALAEMASMVQTALHAKVRHAMETAHPALAPKGKPGRLARLMTVAAGPGFAAVLYFLLGAAFVVAGVLP